nr:hypothetical protein BaRGS_007915 [Batillaria attramentaria]
MQAAKDTETCIRRSELVLNLNPVKFCDPLGDQNIVATLKAEAFDYIGSSRMVYEMGKGRFPVSFGLPEDLSKLDTLKLQKINLTHIAQFIELSQFQKQGMK